MKFYLFVLIPTIAALAAYACVWAWLVEFSAGA